MNFGSIETGDDNMPLAEINMVPLIDVMLVLLVIFLITAPLLTHAVKVDLPRATSSVNVSQPETIELAIDAEGTIFWNGQLVDATNLSANLNASANTKTQPELHIRADGRTPYEKVAQVMSEAARSGVTRIGFVTSPEKP